MLVNTKENLSHTKEKVLMICSILTHLFIQKLKYPRIRNKITMNT